MDNRCPLTIDDMPDEMVKIIKHLSASAVVLIVGGVYLNLWLNYEGGREGKRKLQKSPGASIRTPGKEYTIVSGVEDTDYRTQDVSQYAVYVKDLSKVYLRNGEQFNALDKVSLKLRKGQVMGLLGPNGAGKSTLLSILTGIIQATEGNAWISGFDVATELPQIYKRIGVCPQFDLLWEDLTVHEHLMFYARLKGADEGLDSSLVESTLRKVRLEKESQKPSKQLSGGQKRRLSLAIALIGNPSVIFLDEPTTGLDPLNREELWKILESIKEHTSVIITTHLMQEAEYLSDVISKLRIISYHESRSYRCARQHL